MLRKLQQMGSLNQGKELCLLQRPLRWLVSNQHGKQNLSNLHSSIRKLQSFLPVVMIGALILRDNSVITSPALTPPNPA